MIVEFKKKSILAEDILVLRCGAFCLIKTAHEDVGRDLSVKACRKSNQALAVLPQQGLVDAGFVIKTFEVGLGDKLHEILIATFVLTQNDQMIGSAARGIAILVIGFRNVHLATNDGLYAGFGSVRSGRYSRCRDDDGYEYVATERGSR